MYAGGGVIAAGATAELRQFARTLSHSRRDHADGARRLSAKHELALGMLGMHGTACANYAVRGLRLPDRRRRPLR